jgi:glycosyltransferase involved in cell wall biosynthesis
VEASQDDRMDRQIVPGRFSVVVPSYQQGRYLQRTLESLLHQDDSDLEIIVQDGGSTDETCAVLQKFGSQIQWVSQKDGGQAAAINLGLKKATGEFTCYLNSDDILYPETLAAVRQAFSLRAEVDFIYGQAHHIGEQNEIIAPYDVEPWNYQRLLLTCYLCQPATFWRSKVHLQTGYFDESLQFCLDYEFWLRAGRTHQFHYLPMVLAGSRRHAETKTNRLRLVGHQEIARILPRYAGGYLPLKWARALAKTTAEETIRRENNLYWSWGKYAVIYWVQLLALLPQLESKDWINALKKLSPPYWSSRRQVLPIH